MKKISILFACLVAVLGFNSCSEDTDPKYSNPTEFKLNTPALASQYYTLTEDGTIDLTCSQPNYGYAAAAEYAVQVSLLENFGVSEENAEGEFVELTSKYKTCAMAVSSKEVAEAVCKLRGIESEDDYTDEPARALYFRVRAYINGIEGSNILSNVIKLDQVKDYCAIQSPGYIYLVGAPTGWTGPEAGFAEHYADWRLFESSTAIGSKIYSGVFDIPAGSAMFRFYTALTGWDTDSWGSQEGDSPLDFELTDGVYQGAIGGPKWKGSYNFPNWEGGSMKITVNLNNNTITIEAGGVDTNGKAFIYLVGAPSGWTEPSEAHAAHYEAYKLYDMAGNGVYTGSVDITADAKQFRFYKSLSGWDGGASYGSQVEDAGIDITLTDGVYTGTATDGKGSWIVNDYEGKLDISVDTNSNTVTFTQK